MKRSFLDIIELDTVASTNDYAMELLSVGDVPEGTVIWAYEQTAGKGQGANSWESQPGKNLTFTLILHPRFLKPDAQFLISQCISLGVCDAVQARIGRHKVFVKWPNDIYAGECKIGGILISNTIAGPGIETTIAGIGLNVNQEVFPASLPNPVSLKLLTGKEGDLRLIVNELAAFLENRYQSLREGRIQEIRSQYLSMLLGFRKWRNYRINGLPAEAKITGVSEFGQLMLETRDSQALRLDHHEVAFLPYR